MSAKSQIDLLANYIMKECSFEIDCGGAGDVAIKLLARMSSGIQGALLELGVPDESYPAPVANAIDMLKVALGSWSKGTEQEERETKCTEC